MFFSLRDEVRFNLQPGVVDIPEMDVVMVLASNNMLDNLWLHEREADCIGASKGSERDHAVGSKLGPLAVDGHATVSHRACFLTRSCVLVFTR